MPSIPRGIVAGLAATLVLSAIMLMKQMLGFMPQLDVIGMLAGMMDSTRTLGWVAHFAIGMLVHGIVFALAYALIPGATAVVKGLVFGTAGWLLMMIAVMPMAGAGLFGLELGIMAPVMTLMLHLIFGAVLGATYSALGMGRKDNPAIVTG